MLDELLSDKLFTDLMKVHVNEVVNFLLEDSVGFTILVNMQYVTFDPPLPDEITNKFRPLMPFVLKNFTLISANVDENYLTFEAGFGEENRGAIVNVRLEAILQIIVEDTPILINMSVINQEEVIEQKNEEDFDGLDKSMKALLSNPENKKFFKK